MIHSVEIAFLFISFKRLRLEREQIGQIILDLVQLTSDTSFHIRGAIFKASRTGFLGRKAPLLVIKSR